jgi:hypothetical protein
MFYVNEDDNRLSDVSIKQIVKNLKLLVELTLGIWFLI